MKRIIGFLLSFLMLLPLSACFSNDLSVDQVLDKKAIVMGYDKNYIPMGFTGDNGIYTGFDIDLAKAICKRIITSSGVAATLNIMPISGQDGVAGINNGSIDFLGNSMSAYGDGENNLTYSETVLKNAQVIVVPDSSSVKSKSDLNGKNVAVVPNSVAAEAVAGDKSFSSKITVMDVIDVKTAVEQLNAGNVAAAVMDEVCAKYLISTGIKLNVLDETLKEDSYRLVFSKESKALIKKVNGILRELKEDGTLEELSIKWFGENIIDIK